MWGKVSAGVVLGLPLSVFLLGALAYALPGPWQDSTIGVMLLLPPVWMAVITASASFRNGLRAWRVMALCTALAFALLSLARLAG
ncbi:hypothetical protein ACDA63_06490 [Uliginosibacterium sp. sgz301328]|uniref:hypothetical protein n=1 Tax=Uliginosibacterium sp. sgz301328 TaxID=3243764 RepID=UPI00359E3AFA